jgi:nucleotide-binding universal stress UspA family protein
MTMTYSTVMVNLELGCSNAGVMAAAGDLAERFGSSVIGIAACRRVPVAALDADYLPDERSGPECGQLDCEVRRAEAEFRDAMHGRAKTISWRSKMISEPLADYLGDEARCADIVVTAASADTPSDLTRRVNPGDLLMTMGRPVLVVPSAGVPLNLDRAVVAWKESRQARRAVVDALPLLQKASHVAVATIAAADVLATARSCVADVIGWLKQHGIKAVPVVARPNGDDAAQLQGIARDHDAGVIVAGAFGHSRLRDWALGGVTRHLLLRGQGCALLSH